ncbi:SulP family inorganic anion transporter [Corynebacterium gallinarum]|uniref:SulP family inorganic anion transporter n=1 Tax=Corynebacterium gallinarum TaxID=2762214 RepID=A0A8I0HPI9_9CORY|nr:SulP family inorganic anion transporter [Corynebacterium gallinarum]MBD8029070.1 SulP family inorganic anion transporter [Corynebacterium gallinarum]
MTETNTAGSRPTPASSEALPPNGVVASFRYAFSSMTRLRTEVFAGLAVSLALIPEAIAFSILAGVDASLGLFASVIMAVVISFTGGRPAMITAATGAVALVIAPVVRDHGVNYFIATVLLAGVFQIVLALLGVAKLQRFIPRSVMLGFVNALGILIFVAQLEHLIDVPWLVYPLFALGLVIMVFFPKLTSIVPAPLITIVVLTALVVAAGFTVPTVSDTGEMPDSLPSLLIPDVPYTVETLQIIAPYALGMAIVGLMESLMTAKLVDDITDTHSDKTRESWGQGVANIVSGLFGGMGGCAMIGQTMINVRESGARTRLSTLLSGVFLLIFIVVLGDIVGMIPMAALVAIMVIVSLGTIDWHSIHPRTLKFMPLSETTVMVVTVVATLATNNLAIGVVLGVVTAMIMFARRVAHLAHIEMVEALDVDKDGTIDIRTYRVYGQLFWASSNDLVYQFDYNDEADHIIIDMAAAEIWDASTVATLDSITQKFQDRGKTVEIIGLDGPSRERLAKLSGKLN